MTEEVEADGATTETAATAAPTADGATTETATTAAPTAAPTTSPAAVSAWSNDEVSEFSL